VEKKVATTARQRRGKHISAEKNRHATIEELLEAVFSAPSVARLYSGGRRYF
jgi:hypothetical protein